MRRSIPLVLAALALVAVAVAPAAAASPTAEAKAKAEHARIVKYWTAERIANAKPRDIVRNADGSFEYGQLQPKARPQPPSGGNVTGASWAGGGDVVKRTGKVLFTMPGGNYVCSGTVITDNLTNHSVVLSAAHCIYDEAADVFATNWIFVPSYDTSPTFTCAQATFGCWTAQRLVVHSGWANEESLTTQATMHDFGVAVVGDGSVRSGVSVRLETAVGGRYAVTTTAINAGTRVHAFGYPAQGRYKGSDLTYCAGPTFTDQYNEDETWGIACNMTGGSSGGPWIKDFANNGSSGTVTSLNSYGYSGLSNMYGPKFNSDTAAVVNAASASGSNRIVP
jgi:V8-like Glu-specific endopeptidase